jgi:hypothetical protein
MPDDWYQESDEKQCPLIADVRYLFCYVSRKLRSLRLRLGCFSLRSALASI